MDRETLDRDIDNEISAKIIEKQVDEEPTIKPKKERSEAQKKAFEKARAKRAENLKKKQEVIETNQELCGDSVAPAPVQKPKRGRGRPRGSTKAKKDAEKIEAAGRYPQPTNNPVYQPVNHGIPFNNNQPNNYLQYNPYQAPPPPPPAPVNNYYYYGGAPAPKSPPKSPPEQVILPPEETSSEEEEEPEEYYPDHREDIRYAPEPEVPRATMKYRFG